MLNSSMRNLLLLAAAAGAVAAASPAGAAETARITFDIEASPLSDALQAFGEQSGAAVIYAEETVAGRRARAVKGLFSEEEALSLMLADTELVFRSGAANVYLIEAPAEAAPQPVKEARARNEENPGEFRGDDEIVVTGTNIRGVAPESSPMQVFDRAAIEAAGFQSLDLFMRSIPQVFGGSIDQRSLTAPSLANDASNNNTNASGVNLRGLGAGSTLTLLNGQRMAPSGRAGGFTDISSIPLSAVERVEILTDGASAIYGSDAIAGVVNFVLRDDYEGAETRFGFGTATEGDLQQYRASQLIGGEWGSGHALANYEFFDVGELSAEGKAFAADAPLPSTLLPGSTRHSAMVSAGQDLLENISVSALASYANRKSSRITNFGGPGDPILQVGSTSEQFSFAPGAEISLAGGWRVKLSGNYSAARGVQESERLDLDDMNERRERNLSHLASAGLTADGPLLRLPGGIARLAAGGEFRSEDFEFVSTAGSQQQEADREIFSAFAELFFPVIGKDNAAPGIRRFEISAAARFDDYSDFGSTANPKVGALWEPFDGLILRGSWGTSFNPPTLGVRSAGVAQLALVRVSDPSASDGLAPVGILLGVNPDVAPEEGETLTAGFDVRKEFGRHELTFTSTYYAITYDNLISRVPYPNNSLFNVRTAPQLVPAEIFYPNPSQEVVDGALAAAQASFGVLDLGGFLSPDGGLDASLLQYFYDYRNTNLAAARTRGLDFALRGSRETRKGEVSLGVSGNYIFELTRQGAETIPEVDLAGTVFNPVDFTLRGEAGWSHGPWRASAFANYRNAYIDNRSDPAVAIDSYTTVDMNVRCALGDFTGSRALDGLDISIGVINLFNEDPPFVASDIPAGGASTTANYDPANADPRGRFVHFEIAKRW